MDVGLVVLALAVLLGGAAVTTVGLMALTGKLPPNGLAGIRTGYTRASPENWYRTHKAAAPILIFGSIPVSAVALALLPFVLLDKIAAPVVIGVAAGSGFILATTALVSAWYGISMAKSVSE